MIKFYYLGACKTKFFTNLKRLNPVDKALNLTNYGIYL